MAQKPDRGNQIQYIIEKALKQQNYKPVPQQKQSKRCHLMRAVFIAIDLTESMHIRDIKPTRLAVTIDLMKKLIKKMKDITPICQFMIAKVQNQLCKPLDNFSYNESTLLGLLDGLKISNNPGFFSLENTLSVALDYFDSIPNTFHKQMIIVQSSPFTKDYRDIYETISIFHESRISVNIASLVGWTFAFQKLVEACHGRYVTIGSQKQFQDFIALISQNPPYNEDKVLKKMVKISLARREFAVENSRKMCFCHYEPVQQYFICGACSAVLCQKMPMQCAICMTILVFPSDLYRHHN